jgi:hypothetical protein
MRGRRISRSLFERTQDLQRAIRRSGFTKEEVFTVLEKWYGAVQESEPAHRAAPEPPAPCICSEAYGVGPDKCPATTHHAAPASVRGKGEQQGKLDPKWLAVGIKVVNECNLPEQDEPNYVTIARALQEAATPVRPEALRDQRDNLLMRLSKALAALREWEHWYSVDSVEYKRDNAREAGLRVLEEARLAASVSCYGGEESK